MRGHQINTRSSPRRADPEEIRRTHKKILGEIEERLRRFARIWETGSDEDLFCELVFCLLTPQSSAVRCSRAVDVLKNKGLILGGACGDISGELNIVRFRNNKARYIVDARALFSKNGDVRVREAIESRGDAESRREWLAGNVMGMGYKEASHFLRNIGIGEGLAILDRHILKNLVRFGVIDEIPSSMSAARYVLIEGRMREFSRAMRIPLSHLDFVLWYRETGMVFK
jgi:N-glycosylase/DNA lyase